MRSPSSFFARTSADLLRLTAAILIVVTIHDTSSGTPTASRPNVLLICVDDLRNCLELDGDPIARTPNLDRLAAEGRYFRQHHVQVAACGPSRCSMLTGRRIIGTWDVWNVDRKRAQEPANPVSFAHHFRRHGYATTGIGKISHEPGGTMPPEYAVHQVPYSWDKAFAPVGLWKTPWHAFFAYSEGQAYNAVIRWVKDEPPRLPLECGDVGDDGYADYYLAQAGVEQLRRLADGDRPFLLAVGFYKPHLPHASPKKYWDMFPAEKVGMPENFHPPKNVDPSICIHKSVELTGHYHWPSGLGNISRDEAVRQRRAYYAAVAYVDAQIGKVLDALRGLPCADNTIVVLWSDHGWQLGEHRMFSKHSNYERATNSPLIIKTPGIHAPGKPSDGIVEAVDLFPTLTDLCQLPTPDGLAGQSLRAMLESPKAPGKPAAYSTHGGGRGYRGHALRTEQYRLVRWLNAAGEVGLIELYDHHVDPEENVNIAAKHSDVVAALTKQLETKMAQVVSTSHAR
ncbi:MAG: sulfatase [Thermoguttaceae bacterium]